MNEIIEKIKEDLSFDDLGLIAKTALSKIYSKLRNEVGYSLPMAYIQDIDDEYVKIMFVDNSCSYSTGEHYESNFYI